MPTRGKGTHKRIRHAIIENEYQPLIVRWENGTYSILLGTGDSDLFDLLDNLGEPTAAQVRLIPVKLAPLVCLNQQPKNAPFCLEGAFSTPDEIWRRCTEQVWPLEKSAA